jgi:hypothetical protein
MSAAVFQRRDQLTVECSRSARGGMDAERPGDGLLSRRSLVRELLATAVSAALVPAMMGTPVAARAQADDGSDHLFRELDQKIRSGMQAFAIPGVAVGIIHQGKE